MTSSAARKPAYDLNAMAACVQKGDFLQAIVLVDNALKLEPANAELWYLKGVIHRKINNRAQAINAFNRALQERPNYEEACRDLARTLDESTQPMLAIKTYEHLLRIQQVNTAPEKPAPKLSAASEKQMREWFREGLLLHQKGQAEKAIPLFRKVLAIYPDMPEALTNLAMMYYSVRRFDEAEATLLKVLKQRAGYAEALNLLGNVYKETTRPLRAIAAYKQALAVRPNFRHAAINVGKVFYELRNYPEAIKGYEYTLTLDPDYVETLTELTHMSHLICKWDKVEEYKARTEVSLKRSNQCAEPFIYAVIGSPEMQNENARRWTHRLFAGGLPYDPGRTLPSTKRADSRLRIGYLSSDFHRHATAALISELFEQHDRTKFEIYGYSYGIDDGGPERARIINALDHFCDIRMMDDPAAADRIMQDDLDIMVDLKGYTQGHRLGLLQPRLAPIQMHYLGHPGTLGAPFVDYFITDPVTTPEELSGEFCERLIRLPHTYQMNDRNRPLPRSGPSREAYGLPAEGFVFCDFNNPYKITPQVFTVWMRLLKAVEGSVLWLYENQPEATQRMRDEAAKLGVDPSRIYVATSAPLAEHLARYRHADLFIDTFPVGGHTTTSDALWCGVPTVALMGKSFISRVAGSLLHAVGLPELVTNDLESYEALALSLARDPERLQRIRRHLDNGRMTFPLFDTLRTTHALEAAYLHAAALHRDRVAPKTFNVTADFGIA